MINNVPVKETEASRRGGKFIAANGTDIPIFGEQEIRGKDDTGRDVAMRLTCADVQKTLASVRKMVSKGNRVVFDEDASYIQNKATGIATPMRVEGEVYVFDVWVPTPSGSLPSGFTRPV